MWTDLSTNLSLDYVGRTVYPVSMEHHPFELFPEDQPLPKPREKILAAAHRLFYAEGVRATGVDRIIAEARVTKVTFYRQFPSKDELVLAYLDDRHRRWMAAFEAAIRRHGFRLESIVPALQEWFESTSFRGCAFINALGELGGMKDPVVSRVREHKREVRVMVAALTPRRADGERVVQSISMAMDGAIVWAAWGEPAEALESLRSIIDALTSENPPVLDNRIQDVSLL